MRRLLAAVTLLTFFCPGFLIAQDTLPSFTVISKPGNINVISWTNPFPYTSQISIQRSFDSTKNFKTIITVPDANVLQNGVADSKAPAERQFYRLFIVLDSGKYMFSHAKRPVPDTAATATSGHDITNDNLRVITDSLTRNEARALREKIQPAAPDAPKPEKFFVVLRRDTVMNRLPEKQLKNFRDSIVFVTRDTLMFASADTIVIKPFIPKEIYKVSKYVFTEKYGNVMVALPDAESKKYSVSFFDENRLPLFKIEEVPSTELIIDKTNFVHSGWFWFELYEGGKLKEKQKLFVPKDF